jgi:hypothetical protein
MGPAAGVRNLLKAKGEVARIIGLVVAKVNNLTEFQASPGSILECRLLLAFCK